MKSLSTCVDLDVSQREYIPVVRAQCMGKGSYTSNIFFFRNETGVLLFEEKGHQKDKKHVSRQHRYFNDISKRHQLAFPASAISTEAHDDCVINLETSIKGFTNYFTMPVAPINHAECYQLCHKFFYGMSQEGEGGNKYFMGGTFMRHTCRQRNYNISKGTCRSVGTSSLDSHS